MHQADLANCYHTLSAVQNDLGLRPKAIDSISNAIALLKPQGTVDHPAPIIVGNLAGYHRQLGNLLRADGRPGEAIVSYREAIRFKPDDADTHYNLGIALNDQGKPAEAIAAYREAIRLKPEYAEAHTNLGAVLNGQGKLAEAIAEWREAISLKPDLAQPHINLGVVLKAQGKLTDAVAEWREVIRIKPDDPGRTSISVSCFSSKASSARHSRSSDRATFSDRSDLVGLLPRPSGCAGPNGTLHWKTDSQPCSGANTSPRTAPRGLILPYLAHQTNHFGSSARLFSRGVSARSQARRRREGRQPVQRRLCRGNGGSRQGHRKPTA